MKPIIKWPGGKSGEIDKFKFLVPKYERYIEPFFGGGAMYFDLEPDIAIINDISSMLMKFYELVKQQDEELYKYLIAYNNSMKSLLEICYDNYLKIFNLYEKGSDNDLKKLISNIIINIENLDILDVNINNFENILYNMAKDKFIRTKNNNEKKPFSYDDLKDNLITGFISGYYMYFRNIYNDLSLNKMEKNNSYRVANFYYIREFCYGSMFRYNSKGEFNIPYGGISYNKKSFMTKIDNIFNNNIKNLFSRTEIYSMDFEELFKNIEVTEKDFIFLDPPYDTKFSDYEGKKFDKLDQKRLADMLKQIKAKFILIIKNTEYIYGLYNGYFRILTFDKNYTYNVRDRNDRAAEHLIITNIS